MKQPNPGPDGTFFRFLIPAEPRSYRGQRWIKVCTRSAHVLLAGVYLGALVFDIDRTTRLPWLLATVGSGFLMVCLDLIESGAFLLQLRGLVLLAKLLVLAVLPLLGDAGVWAVAAVAFVSVVSSHASSAFRYFLIWGRGRIKGAETSG